MHLNKAVESFNLALVGIVSPATQQWYAARLASLVEHLDGATPLAEIDIVSLRAWRAGLATRQTRWEHHPTRPTANSGLSPRTVHGYVRAVRRFFAWLVEEGILSANPAQRLELPRLPDREPRHITAGDRAKILEAARASSARDYAIVCALIDTACRLGELAGLRVQDLDLGRRRAVVRGKGKGGMGKTRAAYFTAETARALEEYLAGRAEGPVWLGQRGPLSATGIYQVIHRLAERAGVEGRYNPHAFRHGWAKNALGEGASLGLVSQFLGHSDIGVTHHFYGVWADDELAEAASQFSPLGNSARDT